MIKIHCSNAYDTVTYMVRRCLLLTRRASQSVDCIGVRLSLDLRRILIEGDEVGRGGDDVLLTAGHHDECCQVSQTELLVVFTSSSQLRSES